MGQKFGGSLFWGCGRNEHRDSPIIGQYTVGSPGVASYFKWSDTQRAGQERENAALLNISTRSIPLKLAGALLGTRASTPACYLFALFIENRTLHWPWDANIALKEICFGTFEVSMLQNLSWYFRWEVKYISYLFVWLEYTLIIQKYIVFILNVKLNLKDFSLQINTRWIFR
jgi:hypothetical protein